MNVFGADLVPRTQGRCKGATAGLASSVKLLHSIIRVHQFVTRHCFRSGTFEYDLRTLRTTHVQWVLCLRW